MRKEKAVQQKIINQRAWLDWMEIGAFDASEIEEVLDVLARGMRDNPSTSPPSERTRSAGGGVFAG